jgi:hypothetical protein
MHYQIRKLFIVVGVLFSASSFAQWDTYYADDKLTAYYMPARVTLDKGTLSVSSRVDYSQAQTLKGRDAPVGLYASVVETVFIDCKKKTFVVTDTTYNANKDSPEKTVHWVSLAPSEFKWIRISNDPMKAILFKRLEHICTS